jgi:UDP-N-acetyl-D-mannosaminuronic acid dehydrogenase
MSFKSGSDDIRQSPAIKLIEILKSYHAEVLIHDPHVKGTLSIKNALQKPEIVIIATNHKEFRNLIPELNQCGCKLIYDVWGMFDKSDFPNTKYVKFGQGVPSNSYKI